MNYEAMQKLVNSASFDKHVATCKYDASMKLFEAAILSNDDNEADNQRAIIHALQDVILDSLATIFNAVSSHRSEL